MIAEKREAERETEAKGRIGWPAESARASLFSQIHCQ